MSQNERYICFQLATEEFAIPLLSVREVIGLPEITPVPQTPPHFLGIMNLRGQIVSVMDLRVKLGLKPSTTVETAVIILDFKNFAIGMVVDCVSSVQEMNATEAASKPSLESSKANEFVTGVFKKEDHLVLILDIGKALSLEDRAAIEKAKAA